MSPQEEQIGWDVCIRELDAKQRGSNYVALCPFHKDTKPSLTINLTKGIWKCFVCLEGSRGPFTLLMKLYSYSFKEALDFCGIKNYISSPKKSNKVKENPKLLIDKLLKELERMTKSHCKSTKSIKDNTFILEPINNKINEIISASLQIKKDALYLAVLGNFINTLLHLIYS